MPLAVTPLPTLLPVTALYFSQFETQGSLLFTDTNYAQVDIPPNIPVYAIANSQEFYLTPSPQYIVALFLETPKVPFSEFDIYHQVTATDYLRLDLISYKYYLTPEYWWVIALANDLLDPFSLAIGTILRIPSQSIVINEWIQSTIKRVPPSTAFTFGTA